MQFVPPFLGLFSNRPNSQATKGMYTFTTTRIIDLALVSLMGCAAGMSTITAPDIVH